MGSEKLVPRDSDGERNNYQRRYVCLPLGNKKPCFSVGARDPFAGYITPLWLRFHHETPSFSIIRDRLVASKLSSRLVESDGHIWIPLDVPKNVDGEGLVDELIAKAEEIIQVAYQPLP
jgi:hypothetical protein